VTGDKTGWTFDSSMSSSDADWHNRRRERSERHSPERNVEIHDSISSDETRDVRAMVVVDFLWLLFVAFVVLVRAILLSSGNTPC
jgi:hypothetical protein